MKIINNMKSQTKGVSNMAENLEEKKVMSADGVSFVPGPVTPEGGEAKHGTTGADLKKKVHPKADTVSDGVTKVTMNPEKNPEVETHLEETEEEGDLIEETSFDISSLFEGLDLSEEFKSRVELVFEAAVNEAAAAKASEIVENIEAELQEQLQESLNESLEEIVENLDSYLDYIVKEWMEENEIAIESGIKVEMAESFMEGLKELFYEHNVEIDEDTIDVVAALEEEIAELKEAANTAINRNIELEESLQIVAAERIFESMTDGLSEAQIERFKVLSEKLDVDDLDTYENDLATIKESFFKTKSVKNIAEDLDEAAGEVIIEETKPQAKRSIDESVNAYASFLTNLK
jgi:hypothetical protein